MEIRVATIKDLKRIQELNLMLFEKEHSEYDCLLNLGWTHGEIGTRIFKKHLTEEDCCAFVVEDKGTIVGYLVGKDTRAEGYRNTPKMAELDNMFVLKECRGNGVGRMLYEAFVKWCKERGVRMTRVEVTAQNKEAIEFYRKMGMNDYTLVLEGEL